MNKGRAVLILKNEGAMGVVASAARISTQMGTALEIYSGSGDRERDLKLVKKVLASGHKSVTEHQTFSIAFDDVSVLTEQFVIEFRLASFTVKSRRYVDFSDAGYVIPADMSDAVQRIYCDRCSYLFEVYVRLLDMGIPKEDARFVLPYGFRSNFYVTLNARELMAMIIAMLHGRGREYPELVSLGKQLYAQFDEIYPGVLESEMVKAPSEIIEDSDGPILAGEPREAAIHIISAPQHPVAALDAAMRFSGRFTGFDAENMRSLMQDARPRELEILNYCFRIDDVSLACVTHFTRHRMLTLLLRHELSALTEGNYVLPESVKANPEALETYQKAFEAQSEAAARVREAGASADQLAYFAMAGHTTSMMIGINGRELLHFMKLRSCSRAQWEIRGIARAMIELVNETDARSVFGGFGPTCAVTGHCPEGKMCCGHPVTIENGIWRRKGEQ